jgi:hypothetical protein
MKYYSVDAYAYPTSEARLLSSDAFRNIHTTETHVKNKTDEINSIITHRTVRKKYKTLHADSLGDLDV